MISAHWVTRGSQVLESERPRTIHDFYGFPKPLYDVRYPAPGSPEEARRLALQQHLQLDHEWGLDHGAWSVLRHIYPQADVPVFQLSLDHTRTFAEHANLGEQLRELRQRGVLILGSGNLVHNLRRIQWEAPQYAYPWAQEFDTKVKKALSNRDMSALAAPEQWGASLLGEAHPTLEHYAPVLYCLGASDEQDTVTYPYEGIEFGSISMRMALSTPQTPTAPPTSHNKQTAP